METDDLFIFHSAILKICSHITKAIANVNKNV